MFYVSSLSDSVDRGLRNSKHQGGNGRHSDLQIVSAYSSGTAQDSHLIPLLFAGAKLRKKSDSPKLASHF